MSETDIPVAVQDVEPDSHTAEYPFNDEEPKVADAILLTSDGIKFYVNKGVLSVASPLFRTMFTTLPLPSTQTESENTEERPCIPVQDESGDLFQLLSWCDPRGTPSITLDSFKSVLKVADKYGMESIIQRVGTSMESRDEMIKEECIKIYAIAIRYQLPNLAKLAARSSLRLSFKRFSNVEELRHISATSLQNLYDYHFACTEAAITALRLKNCAWRTIETIDWPEIQPLRSVCIRGSCTSDSWWFKEYMDRIEAEVFQTPKGATALDLQLLFSTLNNMSECTSCRSHHQTFLSFVESVRRKIDEGTAKVSLKI